MQTWVLDFVSGYPFLQDTKNDIEFSTSMVW